MTDNNNRDNMGIFVTTLSEVEPEGLGFDRIDVQQ
jgi:hypothetical protein